MLTTGLIGVAAVRDAVATNPLATVAVIVGSVLLLARLPGVIAPERYRQFLGQFPRSVWWGRILIGVVALWAGIVLWGATTDEWAWVRPIVPIGMPIAYVLVILYADQFLALRGAAGLILLVSNLMVRAADRSELDSRLVVTTLAYLWVIGAIWVVVAPHHGREAIDFLMANNRRCRLACAAGVVLGAVLVLLGAFVY